MASAVNVVLAREDLSIPGSSAAPGPTAANGLSTKTAFFDLVSRSRPDVIVLDLSRTPEDGAASIVSVRRQCNVPILVACARVPRLIEEYGRAGASDFIPLPIDFAGLSRAIQKVLRLQAGPQPVSSPAFTEFHFDGVVFHPGHEVLTTVTGSEMELSRTESRLLEHFASRPWTLCTRGELAALLRGKEARVPERAIDVTVSQLRRKLGSAGIADAERLIRTEPRRGYLLATDVRIAAA